MRRRRGRRPPSGARRVHVEIRQAFLEPKGDTTVDNDPRRRRRRRRPMARLARGAEANELDAAPPEEVGGPIVDPGNTLARSGLAQVRVREAIVKRNHRREAVAAAPRRPSSTGGLVLVRIDWVRARDIGLRVDRLGPDTICISGRATGRAPRAATPAARSASSAACTPALSIGIDGVVITEPVCAGEAAAECVDRWCAALGERYVLEVMHAEDGVHVRFVRPRRLCA